MSSDPATRSGSATPPGPGAIVLVRHGESLGNVADRNARAKGAGRLDLDIRDADVELSPTGEAQADALGAYVASLPVGERPTMVLSSPYRRAAGTARRALQGAGVEVEVVQDERLRERDLGWFDGLTGTGIREAYPDEARRRSLLGKFYYRPPGGESWCDVLLRVRSLLSSLESARYDGARLWIFSHQAVIMAFRLCLEHLDEHQLLGIDSETPLGNCSLTRYEPAGGGGYALVVAGDTTPVDRAAEVPVTQEPESAGKGERVGS